MTEVNPRAWVRENSTKTRRLPAGVLARPSTAELRRWMRSKATPVVVRMYCYDALRWRTAQYVRRYR